MSPSNGSKSELGAGARIGAPDRTCVVSANQKSVVFAAKTTDVLAADTTHVLPADNPGFQWKDQKAATQIFGIGQ